MLRKFFNLNFGSISVEEIFKAVFILGLIPIVIINFGVFTGGGNMFFRPARGLLSILCLLVIYAFFTLLSAAVWKIACELLFLVFKSLKVYIGRNHSEEDQ